jgi:hypothetical protein
VRCELCARRERTSIGSYELRGAPRERQLPPERVHLARDGAWNRVAPARRAPSVELQRKFHSHGMETVVASILSAQGYTVWSHGPGTDGEWISLPGRVSWDSAIQLLRALGSARG